MYYIYDSYHISSSDWKRDLREIRNVAYLIGLVLDKKGVRHQSQNRSQIGQGVKSIGRLPSMGTRLPSLNQRPRAREHKKWQANRNPEHAYDAEG